MSKIVLVFFVSCLSVGGTLAHASHGTDLRASAERYRDAASHFGREVIGTREFGVYEKRLGYDLLRLSSRMQLYSRTPGLSGRLRDCWWELEDLHQRIESILFADPTCPMALRLLDCYRELVCAYYDLETALATVGCYHRHGQIHLNHSHVVPMLGPNRYHQPTLMDVVIGAVVNGLDSSRSGYHVQRHDHQSFSRSGGPSRALGVAPRDDDHRDHQEHQWNRSRAEPAKTPSKPIVDSLHRSGPSIKNHQHASSGSVEESKMTTLRRSVGSNQGSDRGVSHKQSGSSHQTKMDEMRERMRAATSRSVTAKPTIGHGSTAKGISSQPNVARPLASRTMPSRSQEVRKPASESKTRVSPASSKNSDSFRYFRAGKALEEYTRKRDEK